MDGIRTMRQLITLNLQWGSREKWMLVLSALPFYSVQGPQPMGWYKQLREGEGLLGSHVREIIHH